MAALAGDSDDDPLDEPPDLVASHGEGQACCSERGREGTRGAMRVRVMVGLVEGVRTHKHLHNGMQ